VRRPAEAGADILRRYVTLPVAGDIRIVEIAQEFQESPAVIIVAHDWHASHTALHHVHE
jgi:hypothetical protein